MAQFIKQYALDPKYQYTGQAFGICNGRHWNGEGYSASSPWGPRSNVTIFDPSYTTALVNLLVFGYKLSGDTSLLTSAQHFFNRGTKVSMRM